MRDVSMLIIITVEVFNIFVWPIGVQYVSVHHVSMLIIVAI